MDKINYNESLRVTEYIKNRDVNDITNTQTECHISHLDVTFGFGQVYLNEKLIKIHAVDTQTQP